MSACKIGLARCLFLLVAEVWPDFPFAAFGGFGSSVVDVDAPEYQAARSWATSLVPLCLAT